MRVISRRTLINYGQAHPDVAEALKAWFKEAGQAAWLSFDDIHARYGSARSLPDSRVVFKIKGNRCRLVVKINYSVGIVYIRFIGTHAEYDRIDALRI